MFAKNSITLFKKQRFTFKKTLFLVSKHVTSKPAISGHLAVSHKCLKAIFFLKNNQKEKNLATLLRLDEHNNKWTLCLYPQTT